MKKTYFPEIDIVIKNKQVTLSTTLRRNNVEWYSHDFSQSWDFDSRKDISEIVQVFLKDAYTYLLLGNFTEKDQDQRSEQKRVYEDVEDAPLVNGFTFSGFNL